MLLTCCLAYRNFCYRFKTATTISNHIRLKRIAKALIHERTNTYAFCKTWIDQCNNCIQFKLKITQWLDLFDLYMVAKAKSDFKLQSSVNGILNNFLKQKGHTSTIIGLGSVIALACWNQVRVITLIMIITISMGQRISWDVHVKMLLGLSMIIWAFPLTIMINNFVVW